MKFAKTLAEGVLTVELVGVIDEKADFVSAIGAPPGERPTQLRLDCKGVSRINSYGVRLWLSYFGRLQEMNVSCRFAAVSPALVLQANMVRGFIVKDQVESLCAPFACAACHAEFISVLTPAEAAAFRQRVPNMVCPKCGSRTAQFDDVERQYFAFLD